MLLKFFRIETLVIFSSITSYHFICNILRRILMRDTSSFFNEALVMAQDSRPKCGDLEVMP